MPFEARLATAWRLQVELGVVQLNVRSDEVFHDVQNLRIQHQITERLVASDVAVRRNLPG
jgi:hypothetical protein